MSEQEVFDAARLAQFDGAAGRPCYVACEGLVYDVSASVDSWAAGVHYTIHQGGRDLTAALLEAPHGAEALEAFPVVGRYEG